MKKTLFLLPIIVLSLCGCESADTSYSENLYLFDTVVSVKLYDGNQAQADSLSALLLNIDHLLDGYNSFSGKNNLYTLNHTNEETEVDPLLSEYLSSALEIQTQTDGYINPLIGSLSELWKIDLEAGKIPSDEEIQSALDDMNSSSLTVNGNKVIRTGKALLDAGALGKGFAMKKAKEFLAENNIQHYLISAGGSSLIMSDKSSGEGYKVGLRDIDGYYLNSKNTSMGVSSVYQQNWVVNGKTYSHIVNPFTGNSEYKYSLSMAIGDDPLWMDAYSTMFMMRDYHDCLKYESDCKEVFYDGSSFVYSSEGVEILKQ